MLSKRIYLVLLLFIITATSQITSAQIQINTSNLKLCTNNSAYFFLQNSSHPNSSFQWQDSSSLGWSNITNTANFIGVNNDTLFIFNANSTLNNTKVRCIIDSAALNIKKDTTSSALITIYSLIVAPKIKKSQSICYNTIPDSILAIQPASGADANFLYQWQVSNNINTWQDVPGADTLTLYTSGLTDTVYYYRLRATSLFGCGIAYSDTIKINVFSEFKNPKISSNQTICYNTIPQRISLLPASKSVDGKFTYQWQVSSNAINFVDLINKIDSQLIFNQALTSSFYYRLKVTSVSGCGIKYSDTVYIKVLPNITRPTISSSQFLCYSEVPDTLKMITKSTGSDSIFTYRWQESTNGSTWQNLINATDTFLKLNSMTSSKYYRIAAYNLCDTVFSDSVKITIYAKLSAGIIKSNQSICYNTNPSVLSFQTLPSGADGNYSYTWQVSTDSINFFDIVGANNTIYQPSALTVTKYYRLKVVSNFGCGTDYTNVLKVYVYNEFIAAEIKSSIDTICYGYNVDSIYIFKSPKGANGIYSYQWQYSNDSLSWLNLSLANGNKYTSSRLFQNTYYRLLIASNCGVLYSNIIKVVVYSKINKPILNANQSICYNTNPDSLRVVIPAFGADNKFSYSWYESYDGLSWTIISNANSLKYNPGKLTSSKYYKVKAQNKNACYVFSDSLYINVYKEFKSGQISNNQILCYMNESDTLRFAQLPTGAGEAFSLQWQVSLDSINFTNITAATNLKFQAPKSDRTKFYRVRVTSTLGCGIIYTNVVKIKVYDKYIGASITGNDTICRDSIPNKLISIQLPKGGNLQYFYQWQFSTDVITWSNIQNANSNFYQPNKLYETTYYRLINFSGMDCGFDTSNVIKVLVQELPDTTEIVGFTEVCKNQQELFYKLHKTNSQYKYRWFVGKAEILTDDQSDAIFLNWGEITGKDTIRVLQFNKTTGCYNFMLLPIIIKEDRAPNKTQIIRKSNTNILVCEDSTIGLNYQWGYIEKGKTFMYDIPNATLRYVQLPHNFDTTKYVYYVRTIFNGCVTNTFYNYYDPLIFNSVNSESIEIDIYPNPNSGNFKITGLADKNFQVYVYDVLGVNIQYEIIDNELFLTNKIPGIYFIVVLHNNKKYTNRIIVE